jgi:hypothetical protein
MFTLRIEPAPGGLATLGQLVELRELPLGQLTEAMAKGGHHIFAAALHIDGVPIGVDGMQALPGRFAADVAEAEVTLRRMHDLDRLLVIHEAQIKATKAAAEEAPKG